MSKFFSEKPADFHAKLQVSTVFMEYKNSLLLLQRAAHKLSPNLWCIPGGKLEENETPLQGLIREIEEELQLHPPKKDLIYLSSYYVRHPLLEYQLHLFKWILKAELRLVLNPDEHQAYRWQPIAAFDQIPLLEGQLEAFEFAYRHNPP